jgi:hypothetical protein
MMRHVDPQNKLRLSQERPDHKREGYLLAMKGLRIVAVTLRADEPIEVLASSRQ